jgi:hypothetical protein
LIKNDPDVKQLAIDVSRHNMIDADCIVAQAELLESLLLGTGQSNSPSYDVDDIQDILCACEKLKYIAPALRLRAYLDTSGHHMLTPGDELVILELWIR